MALDIRLWDPVRELNRFDNLFGIEFGSLLRADSFRNRELSPNVDIYEKDDKYVIKAEVPGLKKEDIKIDLKDNVLTISGEKKYEDINEKDNYIRVERSYGKFTRRFNVPDNVNPDSVTADYKNGVLNLTLPKKKESLPKQIDVKVN